MKKIILTCIISILLLPVFSQDAEQITQVLKKKTATNMDFSYLIVSSTGMVCSPFEAYTYCDKFGSFRFQNPANTPLTTQTLSHFIMTNYGLKGGIMWSVFQSPRYAYKELKKSGFWANGTDPGSKLSGRDLVRALSRFSVLYPDAQLRNPINVEATTAQINALLAEKENSK